MATRDQLYSKFGITAEAAQLFETSMGTLLLLAGGKGEGWLDGKSKDAAKQEWDFVEGNTLGRVLGRLKDKTDFDAEPVLAHFKNGLEARNRLFHGFYERHNFGIQTEKGREEMIGELEGLHQVLFDCWQMAEELKTEMMSGHVTSDQLHKIIEEGIAKKS